MRIYGEIKCKKSHPPCVVLLNKYYYLVVKIDYSCDGALLFNDELYGLRQIGDWLCELPNEIDNLEE